jgi:hypothetical protein
MEDIVSTPTEWRPENRRQRVGQQPEGAVLGLARVEEGAGADEEDSAALVLISGE